MPTALVASGAYGVVLAAQGIAKAAGFADSDPSYKAPVKATPKSDRLTASAATAAAVAQPVADYTLSSEQERDYFFNGLLVIPEFFTPAETLALQQAANVSATVESRDNHMQASSYARTKQL